MKEAELLECKQALEALKDTTSAYKLYGSILVKKDVKQLQAELEKRIHELGE